MEKEGGKEGEKKEVKTPRRGAARRSTHLYLAGSRGKALTSRYCSEKRRIDPLHDSAKLLKIRGF